MILQPLFFLGFFFFFFLILYIGHWINLFLLMEVFMINFIKLKINIK